MARQPMRALTAFFAVALLLTAQGADAARALRQIIDSMTGLGVEKRSKMALANTLYANSKAIPDFVGVAQNELSGAAVGSYHYPGPNSRTATGNPDAPTTTQQSGAASEISVAAWGQASIASTTNGAVAVAASNAMPLAAPVGTPGTARGVTINTFDPITGKAAGRTEQVQPDTASVGANHLASTAYGMSDVGDGPNAVAMAGQAVASSYSSEEGPPPKVDFLGPHSRRR